MVRTIIITTIMQFAHAFDVNK